MHSNKDQKIYEEIDDIFTDLKERKVENIAYFQEEEKKQKEILEYEITNDIKIEIEKKKLDQRFSGLTDSTYPSTPQQNNLLFSQNHLKLSQATHTRTGTLYNKNTRYSSKKKRQQLLKEKQKAKSKLKPKHKALGVEAEPPASQELNLHQEVEDFQREEDKEVPMEISYKHIDEPPQHEESKIQNAHVINTQTNLSIHNLKLKSPQIQKTHTINTSSPTPLWNRRELQIHPIPPLPLPEGKELLFELKHNNFNTPTNRPMVNDHLINAPVKPNEYFSPFSQRTSTRENCKEKEVASMRIYKSPSPSKSQNRCFNGSNSKSTNKSQRQTEFVFTTPDPKPDCKVFKRVPKRKQLSKLRKENLKIEDCFKTFSKSKCGDAKGNKSERKRKYVRKDVQPIIKSVSVPKKTFDHMSARRNLGIELEAEHAKMLRDQFKPRGTDASANEEQQNDDVSENIFETPISEKPKSKEKAKSSQFTNSALSGEKCSSVLTAKRSKIPKSSPIKKFNPEQNATIHKFFPVKNSPEKRESLEETRCLPHPIKYDTVEWIIEPKNNKKQNQSKSKAKAKEAEQLRIIEEDDRTHWKGKKEEESKANPNPNPSTNTNAFQSNISLLITPTTTCHTHNPYPKPLLHKAQANPNTCSSSPLSSQHSQNSDHSTHNPTHTFPHNTVNTINTVNSVNTIIPTNTNTNNTNSNNDYPYTINSNINNGKKNGSAVSKKRNYTAHLNCNSGLNMRELRNGVCDMQANGGASKDESAMMGSREGSSCASNDALEGFGSQYQKYCDYVGCLCDAISPTAKRFKKELNNARKAHDNTYASISDIAIIGLNSLNNLLTNPPFLQPFPNNTNNLHQRQNKYAMQRENYRLKKGKYKTLEHFGFGNCAK
jgi:hypothetical protein